MVYNFIYDKALQCISFAGISYFIWKIIFYTIRMLPPFTLNKNIFFIVFIFSVCFFLSDFLITKKGIKTKIIEFCLWQFFDSELAKKGDNHYQIQKVKNSFEKEWKNWYAFWQTKLKNLHAFGTLARLLACWHVKMRSWHALGRLARGPRWHTWHVWHAI